MAAATISGILITTIVEVSIVVAAVSSMIVQLITAKKNPEQNDTAKEAKKGFEAVVEGSPGNLPIVYGKAKIGGIRVYHNISGGMLYTDPLCDKTFVTGKDITDGGTYDVVTDGPLVIAKDTAGNPILDIDGNMSFVEGPKIITQKTYSHVGTNLLDHTIVSGARNEFLFYQQALCIGPIHNIIDVVIDETKWLDDPSLSTYGKINKQDPTVRWNGGPNDVRTAVRINTYYNTKMNTADPMLSANFSERSTSTFDGMAYATCIFRLDRNDAQFSGIPTAQFLIEGKLIRKTLPNGTLNPTYEYSNNPAWCLLDYLLDTVYGAGVDVVEEIDLPSFIQAAAICDTIVQTNAAVGGKLYQNTDKTRIISQRDIPLYECNIVIDTGKPIRDNVEAILGSMADARLIWASGRYALKLQYPLLNNVPTNSALTLATTITDDDLLEGHDISLVWPSASDKLNFCTVKFHNECENFKEDAVSWPSKTTGNYKRGVGGVAYPLMDNSAPDTLPGLMLNNYGVWEGAAEVAAMEWHFVVRKEDQGIMTLKTVSDDSGVVRIYSDAGALLYVLTSSSWDVITQMDVTLGNSAFDTVYRVTLDAYNTSGDKGAAATLTNKANTKIIWNTRDIAYSSFVEDVFTSVTYDTFKTEDNGVALESELFSESITDYYHAMAKAQELVKVSRTSFAVTFTCVIKDKYLEPGDYFTMSSETLQLGQSASPVYLRVNSSKMTTEGNCEITAQRFDVTQVAWESKYNQYSRPSNVYDMRVSMPSYLTYTANSNPLVKSAGTLNWNQLNDTDVEGYVIYMYVSGESTDSSGYPIFHEIGRASKNTFNLPDVSAVSAYFAIRAYTKSGRFSLYRYTDNTKPILLTRFSYSFSGLSLTSDQPATNKISWSNFTVILDATTPYSVAFGNATWTSGTLYLYYDPILKAVLSTTSSNVAYSGKLMATWGGSGTNIVMSLSPLIPPINLYVRDTLARTFYSKDVVLTWDNAPANLSSVVPLSKYLIQIINPDSNAIVWSETVKPDIAAGGTYTLTYDKNTLYFGTAKRSFVFKVYSVDMSGSLSDPIIATISNSTPSKQTASVDEDFNGVTLRVTTAVLEKDITGFKVWAKPSADWTAITDSGVVLVYDGTSKYMTIPRKDSLAYYYKVAAYDAFNQDNLVLSNSYSQTALSILNQRAGSGINVMHPSFCTFEANSLDSKITYGVGGSSVWSQDITDAVFGDKSLKLTQTTTNVNNYAASPRIFLEANKSWIVSCYVRCSVANFPLRIFVRNITGGITTDRIVSLTTSSTINTWTRLSGVIDLSNDTYTSFVCILDPDNAACDIWFDGLMLEVQTGTLTTPSTYHESPNFLDTYTGSLSATRNVFQGAWTSTLGYIIGDIVTDYTVSWICLADTLASATHPVQGTTWATYIGGNTGKNGDSVDIVFARVVVGTTPANPTASTGVPNLPIQWYTDVSGANTADGTDKQLWASTGKKLLSEGNYTWGTPVKIEGSMVSEISVYSRVPKGTTPTITGGKYTFGAVIPLSTIPNPVGTGPFQYSWSSDIVTGSAPLWVSRTVVSTVAGDTNPVTITSWSTPSIGFVDGLDGVASNLSNSDHTIPTDSAGLNGIFTGCTTTMSIYLGGVSDSANWTYVATLSSGVTSNGSTASNLSNIQTVTALSSDTGTITIVASKSGFASQTQVFTLSKNKSGVAYQIVLSNRVIKNTAGTLSPTALTLTANKIDSSGVNAYSGRFKIYVDGTSVYSGIVDEANKSFSAFTSSNTIIKCELYLAGGVTTLLDVQSIPLLSDGSSAATFGITNSGSIFSKSYTGVISPASLTLNTSYQNMTGTIGYTWYLNGTVISGQTSSSLLITALTDYASLTSNTYKCVISGTVNGSATTLTDSVTIPLLIDGSSSPTVLCSNSLVIFSGPAGTGYTGVLYTTGAVSFTAFIGTTALTYQPSGTGGANTFSCSVAVGTGITSGTGSATAGSNTYSITAPSAMTSDTASVTVTTIIRNASNVALTAITTTLTYSLSRAGTVGLSPATFRITNSGSIFNKNTLGVISPTSLVIATSQQNMTAITGYVWTKNGTAISGQTLANLSISPGTDYASVTSNTYGCTITGTVNGVVGSTLNDTITIPLLVDGSHAPTALCSNENITFAAPASGYSVTFTGGAATFTAFIGSTSLPYAATWASGTASFSCSATTVTSCTVSQVSGLLTITAISADTAYADVTITIKDAVGVSTTIVKRINYSLSRIGASSTVPGSDGKALATIELYASAATAPTVPLSTTTYTFSTDTLGTTAGWSRTKPATDAINPTYRTSAAFTTSTPTIAVASIAAWSTAIVVARNGISVPSVSLTNQYPTITGPAGTAYTGLNFVGTGCNLTAFIGTTQLPYAATYVAGTASFSCSLGTAVNIGGVSGSGVTSTYSLTAATTLATADTGTIPITTIIRDTAGGSTTIVSTVTYRLQRAGVQGPSVVITTDRVPTFLSVDNVLTISQTSIVFSLALSGITATSYAWTFYVDGSTTAAVISGVTVNAANCTITQANFVAAGTNIKSLKVVCVVNGNAAYTVFQTIIRLDNSTAAAGATVGATLGTNVSGTIDSTNYTSLITAKTITDIKYVINDVAAGLTGAGATAVGAASGSYVVCSTPFDSKSQDTLVTISARLGAGYNVAAASLGATEMYLQLYIGSAGTFVNSYTKPTGGTQTLYYDRQIARLVSASGTLATSYNQGEYSATVHIPTPGTGAICYTLVAKIVYHDNAGGSVATSCNGATINQPSMVITALKR